MPSVFRFAPSPNGYLHLGHAFSALLNKQCAAEVGGRLLLRIEDIDTTRCRPEYEMAIHEDLAWLGLSFDEPVRRQSEHFADYRAALAALEQMGLIYPSFESRSEIAAMVAARELRGAWPRDPDGVPLYPGEAKNMAAAERRHRMDSAEPYALRLDMAAALDRVGPVTWQELGQGPSGESGQIAANPGVWGDVILARKDVPASYHLAVTVDDAAQGVSDIVRGVDLFHATAVHRLLQALLGLPQPRYRHHRLILDAAGNKLSKSTAATGLRELGARGIAPAEVRRLVGFD